MFAYFEHAPPPWATENEKKAYRLREKRRMEEARRWDKWFWRFVYGMVAFMLVIPPLIFLA